MDDGFRQFYRTLDSQKFKLFCRGDGYAVFDGDIDWIGHNPKNVAERRGMRELRISQAEAEDAVRCMLGEQRRPVQEFEDMRLAREGFPGNWKDFTDLLLDRRAVPSIAAVRLADGVEVSFLTTSDPVMYTCRFEDDDVFSSLHSLMNEINAAEVVYESETLCSLLHGMGVASHLRKRRESSTRMLCEYLRVDETQYECREYVRPLVCRVDRSALSALNVLGDGHCVMKTFSCYTNQGWRLLDRFFVQPLRSRAEIEWRQDLVDAFRSLDLGMLREFPDLLRMTRRIANGRITLQETLRLVQVIDMVPVLASVLSHPRLDGEFAAPLRMLHAGLLPMKSEVERVVDLDAAERNVYRVRLDVSERLCELDRALQRIEEGVEREYGRVCQVYARTRLDRSSGAFKVTKTEYQKLQDVFKKNGFLELAIARAGVSFSTRELSFLNAEREKICADVEREERHVREKIRAMLREHVSSMEMLNHIVAQADVFNAFSIKARMRGYSKPVFGDAFEVRGGFHPVLEDRDYIPNSIEMREKRMCVVTGPNMGGKSTFLKTCGVIALLAQMGAYVPAEHYSMPLFDGIYVRVGASDCAFTGTSTFMMEMEDIARICRLSTAQSLVVIDELGRGTSAIDGLSIAQAVKEHLVTKGVLCLCATHFPELCGDDAVNKRVRSNGTLLMYDLVDGVCDTSFGIAVAEKVRFPQEVVDTARRYMDQQ